MIYALTRPVSPAISSCELTHLERTPVDFERAQSQHAAYEVALQSCGCELIHLSAIDAAPDGVFVEDTAVVVPGLAVMTRPGAVSRRAEVESTEAALSQLLPVVRIDAPGTLDGGDVLHLGQTLYVGRSARSNDAGIAQLSAAVAGQGIQVVAVDLRDALHLKTAVTAISDDTVLLQPRWVDAAIFDGYRIIEVHPDEPFAANTLRIGEQLIVPAAHARTAEACSAHAAEVIMVEVDELARAEGGVSCCSILVESADQ